MSTSKLTPEGIYTRNLPVLQEAARLFAGGATYQSVSESVGVSQTTLHKWRRKYPDLFDRDAGIPLDPSPEDWHVKPDPKSVKCPVCGCVDEYLAAGHHRRVGERQWFKRYRNGKSWKVVPCGVQNPHGNMRVLIRQVAELSVRRMPWDSIADLLVRHSQTVRKWQRRYPDMWREEFQRARAELADDDLRLDNWYRNRVIKLRTAATMRALGFKWDEIAKRFEMTPMSCCRWQSRYPELWRDCYEAALEKARQIADKNALSDEEFARLMQQASERQTDKTREVLAGAKIETVADCIDLYLEHARKRLAPSTLERREHFLARWREAAGHLELAEATPFHLEAWLNDQPTYKSAWTEHTAVANIQTPFNWCARMGLIPRNPFKGVTRSPGMPREMIAEDAIAALLRATGQTIRPYEGAAMRRLLIFLQFTGCRPIEARVLCWEHVDFEHNQIKLVEHKTAHRTAAPRFIPLHPVAKRLLLWIREHQPDSSHVFLNAHGKPWSRSVLSHRIRRLRERAGLPKGVVAYGFRHAFITNGLINGIDLATMSTLAGHTDLRTTTKYTHLTGATDHLLRSVEQAVPTRRRKGGAV